MKKTIHKTLFKVGSLVKQKYDHLAGDLGVGTVVKVTPGETVWRSDDTFVNFDERVLVKFDKPSGFWNQNIRDFSTILLDLV
jgi:hypothetical protein